MGGRGFDSDTPVDKCRWEVHLATVMIRPTMTRRNLILCVISIASLCISLTLSFAVSAGVQQPPAIPPALLGDKYADLLPEQKVLVDDWFKRFV
jgi:hypothetical protein